MDREQRRCAYAIVHNAPDMAINIDSVDGGVIHRRDDNKLPQ